MRVRAPASACRPDVPWPVTLDLATELSTTSSGAAMEDWTRRCLQLLGTPLPREGRPHERFLNPRKMPEVAVAQQHRQWGGLGSPVCKLRLHQGALVPTSYCSCGRAQAFRAPSSEDLTSTSKAIIAAAAPAPQSVLADEKHQSRCCRPASAALTRSSNRVRAFPSCETRRRSPWVACSWRISDWLAQQAV